MIWLALASGIAGGLVLGWCAHEWFCMRRNGCLIWIRNDAAEWSKKLKAEGWRTKNGRQHHAREQHQTTQIATPQDLLDGMNGEGVPLQRQDTPSTGVANPKRRTDR